MDNFRLRLAALGQRRFFGKRLFSVSSMNYIINRWKNPERLICGTRKRRAQEDWMRKLKFSNSIRISSLFNSERAAGLVAVGKNMCLPGYCKKYPIRCWGLQISCSRRNLKSPAPDWELL